jgi:Tfp pilus assembly protein PilX
MLRLSRSASVVRDEGSALIAVLGVMAVAMIVSVAVASVTLSSLGYTSATRNGVQAQASAEAGIDAVEAKLAKAPCAASYASGAGPTYSVKVSYSVQASGAAWTDGCAGPGAKRVRLVSTGTATAAGATGNTTGNSRTVEAIYLVPVTGPSLGPSGPAVYAFSAAGFTGSGELFSVDGSKPSVLLRKDDVICNGAGKVNGDLVTASGNVKIIEGCKVSGNVWSGGTLTTSGNVEIGGNATSLSTLPGSMALTGVKVAGNAWSAGPMRLTESSVGGRATASTLSLAGGKIVGDAWVAGAVTFGYSSTIGGHLTAKSTDNPSGALGGNTIISGGPGPGPAAGPTPVVPDWVDFNYAKADWVGFNEVAISGACDWTSFRDAIATLASGPGIIDARTCSGPITISNYQTLTLGQDLAIIAKSFDLAGSAGFTSAAKHKLWLIEPDTVADGQPTCPAGGYFTVGGSFTLSSNVNAMIYSPCLVSITSGIDWYGQVFSAKTVINGSSKLHYVAVGLPGVDLSNGSVVTPGGPGGLGARVSILDQGRNG